MQLKIKSKNVAANAQCNSAPVVNAGADLYYLKYFKCNHG